MQSAKSSRALSDEEKFEHTTPVKQGGDPSSGDLGVAHEFMKAVRELSERMIGQLEARREPTSATTSENGHFSQPLLDTDILSAKSFTELKDALSRAINRIVPMKEVYGFVLDLPGGDCVSLFTSMPELYSGIGQIRISQSALAHMNDAEGMVELEFSDFAGDGSHICSGSALSASGVTAVLGAALAGEKGTEGFFYLFLNSMASLTGGLRDLDFICRQLSLVLAHIVTIDTLEHTQREKAGLISLAADMALVRSADELSAVLSKKLGDLLPLSSYGIFYFNRDISKWEPFLSGSSVSSFFADGLSNSGLKTEILQFVSASEGYSWKYGEDIALKAVGAEDAFWKSMGFEQVAGFPLRTRAGGLGVVLLGFQVATGKLNQGLLADLATQLSVAVANIREVEETATMEREKTKLLSFGEGIATARDKTGLSILIKPYLIKIFGIKEFIITLKNSDQVSYSYFMHGLESDDPVDLGPNFRSYSEIPEKGSLIEQVMLSEEPVVFELSQLIRSGALWEYVGAERAMGARLKVGHKDVGILWTQPDQISSFLLKGICAQIAIAVENITANEEIIRKEKEREALLSLNTALSMVRSSDDLERIINNRLKQFLSCSHAVIGKLNDDGSTAVVYLVDPASRSRENPEYPAIVGQIHPVNDGLMDSAALSSSPIAFSLKQVVESGDAPLYAVINYENGLGGLVISRLLSGNTLFGFWMVFFEEEYVDKDKLDMIESLANQISIAINHITTNEEMLRREEEKTMLLEFSNAIASVRDPEVFAGVLRSQLKKLFGIDDYIIYSLSDDKRFYNPLLFHPDHISTADIQFRKHLDAHSDVNDGVFDVTLAAQGPVIHDIAAISLRENVPDYIRVAVAHKLEKIIGVSLKIGQENIGVMNFELTDANRGHINGSMFSSICAILAIAIENIISKERVIKQLQEIDSYKQQLEEEQVYLKEELQTNQNYGEIIGESIQMRETFRMVTQVASSDSTVLILGETGTGKELIARAIHNNSPRRNKLMVKVNCAALPANLIESELFGHERGSFTGATERRIGKFELANNGTLFLDEIGEMPVELQVKLLRAIQEKEIERIGGKGVIKVNVRIIAATNRDLEKGMDEGRFRSDLYYRLNIFPITLSPLRERSEDIPLLARHFISRYAKKTGRKISIVSNKVLQELGRYSWPGNIRELEHLLERSVLLTQGDTLRQVDLPREKTDEARQIVGKEVVIKTIDENEKDHIMQILNYCSGRIAGANGAASLLGVPPSTLNSKLKKLGIKKGFQSGDKEFKGE